MGYIVIELGFKCCNLTVQQFSISIGNDFPWPPGDKKKIHLYIYIYIHLCAKAGRKHNQGSLLPVARRAHQARSDTTPARLSYSAAASLPHYTLSLSLSTAAERSRFGSRNMIGRRDKDGVCDWPKGAQGVHHLSPTIHNET